jgi:hypothetical protein
MVHLILGINIVLIAFLLRQQKIRINCVPKYGTMQKDLPA